MRSAQKAIKDIILSKNCNPIIVRLAWHDSGSYDKVGVNGHIIGSGAKRTACSAFDHCSSWTCSCSIIYGQQVLCVS